MNLALKAMLYARQIHRTQKRKYTDNPYFDHLAEVAGIVASVAEDYDPLGPTMIAVAYLHDSIEDQGETVESLASKFNVQIAQAVSALSDMEEGNRAARHAASVERLRRAPGWVQTIKVADIISNTSSIVQHDPKFARVFLREKWDTLTAMDKADPHLRTLALTMTEKVNG